MTKNKKQNTKSNNCLETNICKDSSKCINDCMNSCNCDTSCSLDIFNNLINSLEAILGKAYGATCNAVQDNISLGEDFLKCKDISDLVRFQKKMFELYFSNTTNFYFDAENITQRVRSQNIESFFKNIDKCHCFTKGEN